MSAGTTTQILVVGDSTVQNTVGGYDWAENGTPGGWVEIMSERFADLPGLGPLLTSGYRHVGMPEWSRSGSWTDLAPTDAFDILPYGAHMGVGWRASGTANVMTATKPIRYRPVVGVQIYYVDTPTTGNWQYRIDGGTWTNMAQSIANDNKMHKFYVATAVTSTVEFRGYTGSADCEVMPAGIEWCYVDPRGTRGLIVHNIAVSGSMLHGLVTPGYGLVSGVQTQTAGTGDRMSFIDQVVLGSGSPTDNFPNGGTIMLHINDVAINSAVSAGGPGTGKWDADLRTLYNRVSPYGPVGFIACWEVLYGPFPGPVSQGGFRAQTHTTATALGVSVLDMAVEWVNLGFSLSTQQANLSPYLRDGTHPSAAGMIDIQERAYRWCPFTFHNHIGLYFNQMRNGESQLGDSKQLLGALSTAVDSSLASSGAAAFNASMTIKPSAGVATPAATANAMQSKLQVTVGVGTASSAANAVTPIVQPNAGLAAPAATANEPSTAITAPAGLASATATGNADTAHVQPNAGLASGAATANAPVPTFTFPAGLASAVGVGNATLPGVSGLAGLATAGATANANTEREQVFADVANATVAGFLAAFQLAGYLYPDVALASAIAYNATIAISVRAGNAALNAAANGAYGGALDAALATAIATAYNVAPSSTATPATATAQATAYDAAVAIGAAAGLAMADSLANAVSAPIQVTAALGLATAQATAYDVHLGLSVFADAGLALAIATAYDATVNIGGVAGLAALGIDAYDVTHPHTWHPPHVVFVHRPKRRPFRMPSV